MTAVFQAWEAARGRGLNNRAVAAELGVTEAELLASGCGRIVTRLTGSFSELLRGLPVLGEIKSVVRNAYAVQERTGRVTTVTSLPGGVVHLTADTFELDAAVPAWCKAFALIEPGRLGTKRSIQLFDGRGSAVAKFFLTPESDAVGYKTLVARFQSGDQGTVEAVVEDSVAPLQRPADAAPASLAGFLYETSRLARTIEIAVGNDAASQRTTKNVERIKRSERGGWINVLDPGLDLHLHEERIRRLRVTGAGAGTTLHWLADDGTEAFSARCDASGEALLRAALR